MKYLDISWNHDSADEPYRLVSEISADGYEKRKLEFFRDNRVGYASELTASETTMLSVSKIPDPESINLQPEFSVVEISKVEFEELWNRQVPFSA